MKHSLANYPNKFLGCVISPTKICIQFSEVSSKLRFKEGARYVKLPDLNKALPITTEGVDVDLLSVGAQLPVVENCQRGLLLAYLRYGIEHSDRYEKEYGKQFIDFLKGIRNELEEVINTLDIKKEQ